MRLTWCSFPARGTDADQQVAQNRPFPTSPKAPCPHVDVDRTWRYGPLLCICCTDLLTDLERRDTLNGCDPLSRTVHTMLHNFSHCARSPHSSRTSFPESELRDTLTGCDPLSHTVHTVLHNFLCCAQALHNFHTSYSLYLLPSLIHTIHTVLKS